MPHETTGAAAAEEAAQLPHGRTEEWPRGQGISSSPRVESEVPSGQGASGAVRSCASSLRGPRGGQEARSSRSEVPRRVEQSTADSVLFPLFTN